MNTLREKKGIPSEVTPHQRVRVGKTRRTRLDQGEKERGTSASAGTGKRTSKERKPEVLRRWAANDILSEKPGGETTNTHVAKKSICLPLQASCPKIKQKRERRRILRLRGKSALGLEPARSVPKSEWGEGGRRFCAGRRHQPVPLKWRTNRQNRPV